MLEKGCWLGHLRERGLTLSHSPTEVRVFKEELWGIDSVSGKINDLYWQSMRGSPPYGCRADTYILKRGGSYLALSHWPCRVWPLSKSQRKVVIKIIASSFYLCLSLSLFFCFFCFSSLSLSFSFPFSSSSHFSLPISS